MIRKRAFAALLTFFAILTALYVIVTIVGSYQRNQFRTEVQNQLIIIGAKLESGLNSRLFLEKGLNAFVLTHLAINPFHQITQQELDDFGKQFMPQLLGIKNISLIQDNIITHVYPLSGNEKAIGVDLTNIPAQKTEILKVRETGQIILTNPVELVQGGVAIIHRSPIFWKPPGAKDTLYWGQTSLSLMEDVFFKEAGLYDLQDLHVAIRRYNDKGVNDKVFWGEGNVFFSDPVIVDVKIPNGYWQLAAVPIGGWATPSSQIYWIGFIGIIFAFSSAALVWFLLSSIEAKKQLKHVSFHDTLTGLYNRLYFETIIKNLEQNKSNISLIICDNDGLKMINDTLGHEKGDHVLIQTAMVLKECFAKDDIVARIGGDEFAVIMKNTSGAQVIAAKRRIVKEINSHNNNHEIPISLSIGYASSDFSHSIKDLCKEADNNMYREKLYQNKSARSTTVQTLLKLLEARDFITEGHAERLQDVVSLLGRTVGLPEFKLVDLRLLAQFHDIGKVGIPDNVLLKPGRLTAEEQLDMRRHSDIGYRIALMSPDLVPIAEYILKHHECWDGSGYPLGLSGENIPLECRILAIADAYDAMTNDRPYRKAMSHAKAIEELKRCAGKQFDPVLTAKFCEILE